MVLDPGRVDPWPTSQVVRFAVTVEVAGGHHGAAEVGAPVGADARLHVGRRQEERSQEGAIRPLNTWVLPVWMVPGTWWGDEPTWWTLPVGH